MHQQCVQWPDSQTVQVAQAFVMHSLPSLSDGRSSLVSICETDVTSYDFRRKSSLQWFGFKVILITFKAIKGAAPNYLQELISFKGNSSYGLRSNDSFLLAQPRQRTLTMLGDRTFAVAAPMLWNCLPVELRNPNISIELFKVKLKTHLFREAYR